MGEKVFPTMPFERENAKKFITVVKKGDSEQVFEMLQLQKFLVHDYDQVKTEWGETMR